ncbi:MAG: hypothetical protein KIS96_12275 [Bauldia sp.]|nr:hypothetical protein [Bauldia sp.]
MTAATFDGLALPSALPLLSERLIQSTRRATLSGFVLAGAIAVSAACVVYGIAQLAIGFGATIAADGLWFAIGAGAAGFVVAAVAVFATRRSSFDLARDADRVFALRERMSTALQVSRGRHGASAVGTALLRDAEAEAAAIDPRRLAPLRPDRVALILAGAIAFLALALVVKAIAYDEPGTAPVATALPAALSTEDQAEVAQQLMRVAALIADDAEERSDPFLQAIAREVAALGQRIESGAVVERSEIVAELDRLANYAGDAYVAAGETIGGAEDLSQLLEAVGLSLEPQTPRPIEQTAAGADGPAPPPDDVSLPPNLPQQPPLNAPALDEMLAEFEAADAASDAARIERGERQLPDGYFGGDYYAIAAQQAAEAAARRQAEGALPDGAMLAGAAEEAGAGDSRLAGEGVGALDGEITENDPFAMAGELLLQDEIDGEGRRIRVEVPPQQGEPVVLVPGEIVAGDWRPMAESEVSRAGIPPADRDAVARYFRSIAEAAE